ncbi:hypothetical protein QPK13_22770 [Photorhabdus tasmaniensis]
MSKNTHQNVPDEGHYDTRTQVRFQLSRSAHRTLASAKEILENRGMECVSTEDLVRACLEENQPLDLASLYLEHRLKQKGTSICEY